MLTCELRHIPRCQKKGSMVNWWLILLAVLIGLGLLRLYILFYYQSEEVVLMLPYDVAAYSSPVQPSKFSSPINTELMWEVVLWMAVPLAMFYYVFYYEAFDPEETIAERKIAGGHSSLSPTPKSCGFTQEKLMGLLKEAGYDATSPAYKAYFFKNGESTGKGCRYHRRNLDEDVDRCKRCDADDGPSEAEDKGRLYRR